MEKIYSDWRKYSTSKGVSGHVIDDYTRHTSNYINPTIIEERQLNVAQMDVFSRLMMDRIVFFGTAVDSDTCNIISSQLMYLDSINNNDIKLYINSPGGEVYSGLAVVDVMNYISSDVSTYCMGMAASMGAILLTSGEKGKRYSLPHGRIMIHQPMTSLRRDSQASDIEIESREINRVKRELYEIISSTSGQTIKKVEKDCDRNYWLTANEAKDYGIIDSVIVQ